ncbi:hypothetical protein FRC19_009016 [Serendipita sp. 401]|nr:hypothetical protein FRC19_009016 [Serendipita sp. 401]
MSSQPYSENNPVPTIQKYEEDKEKQEKQLDAEIARGDGVDSNNDRPTNDSNGNAEPEKDEHLTEGQKEKKEMMEKMNANKEKPTDTVKKRRGDRVVDDPVTGEKVIIKDAQFKDFPTQQQLDPKSGVPGPSNMGVTQGASKMFHQSRTAPNPAHPSNISLQPFPPSSPPSLDNIMNLLYYLEYGIMGGGVLLWFFVAFGHGIWVWLFRSILISALSFVGATVASLAQRKLEREVERVRFDMHRQRGEKYAPPTPESVEWLNAFTKVIWGLINPDMFVPVADSIEDVMQQSLPKFVEAVRISDIGQGTNPFRIVSMRALPDQPGEKEYPREEWIDQGTNMLMQEADPKDKNPKDQDQAGDYVNYEVSFAYQAMPGQGDKLRAKNIHLLLEFFLGFADWVHIPIPIWVQVDGVAGTVRLRIQFIPEPPFVRNLTFTLMGVPAVEVSVTPLIKQLPNILDLPLISTFVKMAISAGTASLVAPKSMTLNLQEMMGGAAIGDTRALGVFIIRIQYAEDLSAQDRNGKSDPYIVLAYAKGASGAAREGQAGQDTDEPSEQGNNLPSGYCEIIINDDLVYKTRVKQYTSMPFFEAGTEVFIRDWKETVVRVVVRDSRLREKDPILGIVHLPLQEILTESSEVTRLFSIQEGVGFGRANISVLFKAVDAKLPRNMLGWDTGTVEVLKPIQVTIDPEHQESFALKSHTLIVSTTDSTEKIGSTIGESDNARVTWDVDKIRLPVYSRYSSSLTFDVGYKAGLGPMKGSAAALAIQWLQDIPDDEEVEVKIPLLVSKDVKTLRQNYVNEHAAIGHEYKTIGYLTTTIKIDSGLDPDHEKYAKSQARRHAYETYDHIEGQAIIAERNAHAEDDGVVDKKEKAAIEAAHKKQLLSRQRGIAQFRPYRTTVWMKEGIRRRMPGKKSSGKREPTVKSEA